MILQKMRGGAGAGLMKFVLLGFLVMAVAGLVFMDVQGFFRGGMQTDTIAKGGGVRIGTYEFNRTVERVLRAQGINPQDAYRLGLINQILHGEIQNRLLVQAAHDMGLEISDEIVMEQVEQIAAPLARGGSGKSEALRAVLRSQGISEAEFIRGIREEMAIGLLRNTLVSGASAVSDDLARAVYIGERETRDVQFLHFTAGSITDFEQPDEARLRTYYEANKIDYAIPETRTITLATLDQKQAQKLVDVSEEDVRAAYDQNIAAYQTIVSREIEQAIFKDREAALAAREAIDDGEDLHAVAENAAYQAQETIDQDNLLVEIKDPVFAARPGDVIGPVLSPQGWHVILVRDQDERETTPFDQVRDSLKKELEAARLAEVKLDTANQIDDRLAGGEQLNSLVKEFGLSTQSIGPFRQTGFNASKKNLFESYGTDAAQLIDAAFDYDAGEASPVMELSDGTFAIVQVDEAKPTIYKPFDEVKGALKERWITEQQALLNRARAQDALARLEKGDDLASIAKDLSLTVQTINALTRTDSNNKAISPIALEKIFTVEQNDALLADSQDGIVLAQIVAIAMPDDANPGKEELQAIKERIAQDQAQEVLMQYLAARSAADDIRINQPLLEQIFGGNNS